MNITGIRFNSALYSALYDEIEVDGYWYPIPRRLPIPHTFTLADLERIVNDQRCIRCKQPLNNVSPGFSRIASGYFVCTHCLRSGEEIARAKSLVVPAQETKPPFRTGDIVHHRPTDETWTVAAVWEGSGDMAWCGWTDGRARISDCDLVTACTDDRHWQLVEEIAQANAGSRTRYCQQLLEQRKEYPQ